MLLIYFRGLWRPPSRQARQDMARQAEHVYANFCLCDQGLVPVTICAQLHMYLRLWRSRASRILKKYCRPESVRLGSPGGSNRGRPRSHHRSPRRHSDHIQTQFSFLWAGDTAVSYVFEFRLWMVGAWSGQIWARQSLQRGQKSQSHEEQEVYVCTWIWPHLHLPVRDGLLTECTSGFSPVWASTELWTLEVVQAIPSEALYC